MYVMDPVMNRLSQRIEAVTDGFTDPAQVYAFGIRNVMIAATIRPEVAVGAASLGGDRRGDVSGDGAVCHQGYPQRGHRRDATAWKIRNLPGARPRTRSPASALLYLTILSCLQKWTRPWSICSAWWVFAAARPGKLRAGPARRFRQSSESDITKAGDTNFIARRAQLLFGSSGDGLLAISQASSRVTPTIPSKFTTASSIFNASMF